MAKNALSAASPRSASCRRSGRGMGQLSLERAACAIQLQTLEAAVADAVGRARVEERGGAVGLDSGAFDTPHEVAHQLPRVGHVQVLFLFVAPVEGRTFRPTDEAGTSLP